MVSGWDIVVAHNSWISPIQGSLHILVDPATHGCRKRSTNRVKIPWVGWVNSIGDEGATERDEISPIAAVFDIGMATSYQRGTSTNQRDKSIAVISAAQ